jgi:hypothetical protein
MVVIIREYLAASRVDFCSSRTRANRDSSRDAELMRSRTAPPMWPVAPIPIYLVSLKR